MSIRANLSLVSLLTAQTQVVFNDNAVKLALMGLAQIALLSDQVSRVVSLLAALLVLPFVLFAPIVGWLSDRYSKTKVLNLSLGFQLFGIIFVALALYCHSIVGAVFGFFLLALQACIFSPAKQGILKELVGNERLGVAVGWMELLTISAILLGSIFGGWSFDYFAAQTGDPWQAALITAIILGAGAVLSWGIFQSVELTAPQSTAPFRVSLFWEHILQFKVLWEDKGIKLSALGVAYFYTYGGFIYLTLVQLGRELNFGGVGAVTDTGIMLAVLGLGVGVGSLVAAGYCRNKIELRLVPIGGLGFAIAPFALSFTAPTTVGFYLCLLLIGIAGAVFSVPLNASLQSRAKDSERGTILASANLLINLGGIFAVAVQYVFAQYLGMSVRDQFLSLVLPSLLVTAQIVFFMRKER